MGRRPPSSTRRAAVMGIISMKKRQLIVLAACAFCVLASICLGVALGRRHASRRKSASTSTATPPDRGSPPYIYTYDIIASHPHDPTAFTQGLVYANAGVSGSDALYESTGLWGQSTVRSVDLKLGAVLQRRNMTKDLFGEGLTLFADKLLQVVWQSNAGFVYDRRSLELVGNFTTPMKDGWGLTHNGVDLIGSDGSSTVYFFDPVDFKETKRLSVVDGGSAVGQINELEYIDGEIWANIWNTDCIARISPETGLVLGWVLLPSLKRAAYSVPPNQQIPAGSGNVLNGIAFDPDGNRLFVTGKLWPTLFEIRVRDLTNAEQNEENSLAYARSACILPSG